MRGAPPSAFRKRDWLGWRDAGRAIGGFVLKALLPPAELVINPSEAQAAVKRCVLSIRVVSVHSRQNKGDHPPPGLEPNSQTRFQRGRASIGFKILCLARRPSESCIDSRALPGWIPVGLATQIRAADLDPIARKIISRAVKIGTVETRRYQRRVAL